MTSGSHLPVHHPDNEKDILHETQLLLMNSNSQLSSQLDDLNVVAYVSGKKSLFKGLMKLKKFYSQDNLIYPLRILVQVNKYTIQGRLVLNGGCNLNDGTKLCSRIKITWTEIEILESHTTYLGHVLERYVIYNLSYYNFCIKHLGD